MKTTIKHIREAMWRAGPGEDALLILEDDDFHDMVSESKVAHSMITYSGYAAVKYDYMGSTVYLSCPRIMIPVEYDLPVQRDEALEALGEALDKAFE